MGEQTRPRAVVLADSTLAVALAAVLERAGYEVVAPAGTRSDLEARCRATSPDLVVVDLTMAGMVGLGVVEALRTLAAAPAVVVLCPFPALHGDALAAGAADLLHPDDLRGVERCVSRLRAGDLSVCTCGPVLVEPTTAVAFDPASSRVSRPRFGRWRQRRP